MQDASAKPSDIVGGRFSEPALEFGPFTLHRTQKLLLEHARQVHLGSRALELLIALVERAGEVLSREELEERAWPHTVVEETSLRVHISALRKALGDGRNGARYITNVPGRGYCFVAPVAVPLASGNGRERMAGSTAQPSDNLPARLTRAIGRDEVTAALAAHLAQRRLVSIVGPGGIGKTTLAVAVATRCLGQYEHGARFVDLAPLTDPSLVPAALAATLGVTVPSVAPLGALGAFLRDRRLLVVLDNCEHVITAAATLAEYLLKAAPQLHILATSREPLDAEGEWVHRLASLEMPAVSEPLTVAQALRFPAIQLFVERASANSGGFVLSDATLAAVRQVCLRLDGIPLAIELAAARVDSLGVQGLAARLDDLFQLLTRGRRTALPRHRTLQALIDWSHDLLTEPERMVLRRLSVFRAGFTLESAACVAACERISPAEVMDHVMALAAKSLVGIDAGGDVVRHRLLHITRTYAAAKLSHSGEGDAVARLHAGHFVDLANTSSSRWGLMSTFERVGTYARNMDDIRAGLDWAFSPKGDDLIGVALAVAGARPTYELGLVTEYKTRIELALQRAGNLTPPRPQLELRLCAAWCFLSGQSASMDQFRREVFARALVLCEQTDDFESRIEMFYSLCVASFGQGNYPAVVEFAQQIHALATGPAYTLSVIIADRLLSLTWHYLGDHQSALALVPRVLGHPVEARYRWHIGQVPREVSMRIVMARILWIQGHADQAVKTAREAVRNATGEHPFAICQALAQAAIPIALWRGERADAADSVEALLEVATRYSLGYWQSWAHSYRRVLQLRSELPASKRDDDLAAWTLPANPMELDMLGTLAEEMAVPRTVERVEAGVVGWCAPEILRAAGENLLRRGDAGAAPAAEALFERALQLAGVQHALSWELRAACGLARLWRGTARASRGRDLLGAVYNRFTEGLDTDDLVGARQLLDEMTLQASTRTRDRHA